MFRPVKVIDVELSQPFNDIDNLADYEVLKVLVRLHGTPIGYVQLPVSGHQCSATVISKTILEQHSWPIVRQLLINGLANQQANRLDIASLVEKLHPVYEGPFPLVTVAVCTRDRTLKLATCLDALVQLDYPALDLLVVDNAPSNSATERLVSTTYPHVRYVREPQPGLNWARNRAIREAHGEIVAFTDDDVVVDQDWVTALVRVFTEDDSAMAVTGLVVPYELETEAQFLFEEYGGFGRGFERRWFQANPKRAGDTARRHGGAGKFGTGANMAFRRTLFDQIGYFDLALDVGTVTNGGGDLDMFYRVLKEGHVLVYEPSAIIRHCHRREYEQLRAQLTNNGIGFYSYLVRNSLVYPEERRAFVWLGLWWFWWWSVRRLLGSLIRPYHFPLDLILAELCGSIIGLGRYQQARRTLAKEDAVRNEGVHLPIRKKRRMFSNGRPGCEAIAVRLVDVSGLITSINDVTEYERVRIFISWQDHPLGQVDIENCYHSISAMRLQTAIVDALGIKLLLLDGDHQEGDIWTELIAAVKQRYGISEQSGTPNPAAPPLPDNVPVSVVVATRDRPDDLRRCLKYLTVQQTKRPIEIVVVDNNPDSGLTKPVVAEYDNLRLVNERRKGLSFARNAGIRASTGDIVICTDDDVSMPPGWLERLIAPFARNNVMVVTGNVLPGELETRAQQLFEIYGGLGRGFKRFEVGRNWFESFRFTAVPTWHLGATANAAFRASIFSDPQIGLMDEALGAGTPTGCSEDTLAFYRVLKAGGTIVYEPSAFVWHSHRRTHKELQRQLYNYSKGHVAYHLITLFRNRDLRVLPYLLIWLPYVHLWRIVARLGGRYTDYPLILNFVEIIGNLVGPWALWRSRRQAKRLGSGEPYIPVSDRALTVEQQSIYIQDRQQVLKSPL